ncbi:MASE1 domain-containing protein [Caulobacter sp. KR2-114]|uniref:MASE1 domain-containing protein n=1 Tax=Caulobacter sp. KR2-114 TaxID=3400912 RepID=UPI003BFCF33F
MDVPRNARQVSEAIGLWAAFAGSVAVSILLGRHGGHGAALWTANGFLVSALLILPRPHAAAVLAACIASQAAIGLVAGDPLLRVSVSTAINIGGCVLTAWLAHRYCGIKARRLGLVRLARILVLAALPASFVASLAAALTFRLFSARPAAEVFGDWMLSSVLGLAMVLPAVLLAARQGQYREFRRPLWETLGLFAGLGALTVLVFYQAQLPVLFAVFPAVTLIAFRLGPPGAAVAGFFVGMIALPLTLFGHGPATLARSLDFAGQIRLTQTFVCCVMFTGVGTAIALADQTRLRRMLIQRDRVARVSRQRALDAERLAAAVGARPEPGHPSTRLA